jgi:hypothetical protein
MYLLRASRLDGGLHRPYMRSVANTPLDVLLAGWWSRIDSGHKKGFLAAGAVSLLAFGFEMTNLALQHDDVLQFFIQDTILGHYLGRFGAGWLHYYTQSDYFMPFLQMTEGIVFMGLYGVLVAHYWGARKTLDIALIATLLCVFPYMAHLYQYNTARAIYPLAHLLAASAVVVATRATFLRVAAAALLIVAALSIYQAVIANAAAIFLIWFLIRSLFKDKDEAFVSATMIRSTVAVTIAAVLGGLLYLLGVSFMDVQFDSEQAADKAFSLSGGWDPVYAATTVLKETRAFFLWPENYFPGYLKNAQLILMAAAAVLCVWIPKRLGSKVAAVAILVAACFAPRILQFIHPQGTFHSLTLTAYAVVVAGALTIILRAGRIMVRNAAVIVAFFLIAGYVIQCNWISTVNYFNSLAHFSALTQLLAKIRSIPDVQWDGKTIAVVGTYDMSSAYPFKSGAGVAPRFLDAEHMGQLARLMRDDATFVRADQTMPKVLEYAATHAPWPNPAGVGVVDGMGVIVFSKVPKN